MKYRKYPLANGQYYHIFSRSIAKYMIFNYENDYGRFNELLNLYRFIGFNYKYSNFANLKIIARKNAIDGLDKDKKMVEIVAYCIMPTHIHLG